MASTARFELAVDVQAFAAITDSEAIWLAAFKLEFENEEPQRARALMAKARNSLRTQRVWMKSAIVERELARHLSSLCFASSRMSFVVQGKGAAILRLSHDGFGLQGDVAEERRLLQEGLDLFPAFDKLWLMLGQLEERLGAIPAARTAYQTGLKRCIHRYPMPTVHSAHMTCWQGLVRSATSGDFAAVQQSLVKPVRDIWRLACSVPLWRSAARLEEQAGNTAKARALLEQGRLKNVGTPELWLAAVRTEQRAGLHKAADSLMAKALQVRPALSVAVSFCALSTARGTLRSAC